jgi:hypothetical protein
VETSASNALAGWGGFETEGMMEAGSYQIVTVPVPQTKWCNIQILLSKDHVTNLFTLQNFAVRNGKTSLFS